MAEDTENVQLTPATSGGDGESRIAALEQRFDQLEAKLLSYLGTKADRTVEHAIRDQARLLAKLQERHENLLRHTPDAREKPVPWEFTALALVIFIIIGLAVFAH